MSCGGGYGSISERVVAVHSDSETDGGRDTTTSSSSAPAAAGRHAASPQHHVPPGYQYETTRSTGGVAPSQTTALAAPPPPVGAVSVRVSEADDDAAGTPDEERMSGGSTTTTTNNNKSRTGRRASRALNSALCLSTALLLACWAASFRPSGGRGGGGGAETSSPDRAQGIGGSSPVRGSGSLPVDYMLGGNLNFRGILSGNNDFNPADDANGGGAFGGSTSSGGSSTAFDCEYTDATDAFFDDATGNSNRDVRVVQTSKRDPGAHWGEVPCRRRLGDADEFAAALRAQSLDDAANIVIDLPSTSTSTDEFGSGKPRRYQRILGFGGSITEATTLNWKSLSTVGQDRVLELLYGNSGLGYTLGRMPMGSCDFSVSSYNFAEKEDLSLDSFDRSVLRDVQNGMVDMIKRARYVTEHSWEDDITLRMVASPWSPPPWMKTPLPSDPFDAMHAGSMERTVLPECLRDGTKADSTYARAWAEYFSEFLTAYRRHGINIWAVTVQNEPLSYPDFEACGHDKTSEKEFVALHLGPVLSEDHPEVKILAYDYNKAHCVDFMEHLWDDGPDLEAREATEYIDGVALHWYSKSSNALNGGEGAPNMHRLAELASRQRVAQQQGETEEKEEEEDAGKPILLDTEATHCTSTGYAIGDIDVSWQRAERNAHAILSQLAAGSNGWIEWNMMLDPFGGPNHVENFCDAPLVAVPHRAHGLNDFSQPVPAFEKHQLQDGESIKGEYETKFALSQVMGYPMSFLDVGVVVQPMFYYVGHISRFVRPGSRPLRAIVDESPGGTNSRVFRPTGKAKPGGGYNQNARVGTEVTLWPCEGSTRQSWVLSGDGQLQVIQTNDENRAECSALSKSADPELGGVLLTDCGGYDAGFFNVIPGDESGQIVKFASRRQGNQCLGIMPLANDGGSYGIRGGAQATMVPCKHHSSLWEFLPETGEVLSNYFSSKGESGRGAVCLTTGWPFLQAGVFDTSDTSSDSDAVMIVLNESEDAAKFVVAANGEEETAPILKSSIPGHSIQTILL